MCQIRTRPYHSIDKWWAYYNIIVEPGNAQQAYTAFQGDDNVFYADSSVNSHMTNQEGNLVFKSPYTGHDKNFVGNGNSLSISHTRKLVIPTSLTSLKLNDVLVVPKLKKKIYCLLAINFWQWIYCWIHFFGLCNKDHGK